MALNFNDDDLWQRYNLSVALLLAPMLADDPDAIVRFDFNGEGWGFSYLPGQPLPGNTHEVYGEGIDPMAALEDAVDKWEAIIDAA